MNNETFYLKTGLIFTALADKNFDQFRIEAGLSKTVKHNINFQIRKLDSIERDMTAFTSSEVASIIRSEISSNWELLSIQNVLLMLVEMTDEQRNQVEQFTEKLLTSKL